jgi:hypothetical protein
MDNHDHGEALFLIGKCSGLEPMVEARLAAAERGNVVGCGEGFRA